MKKIILAIFVMTWFITGCSTFPKDDIKVDSDADPKVNFSAYKTYAWLAEIGVIKDSEGQWVPPNFDAEGEIQFLVNESLRKRGMTEVTEDPDMFVTYALGVDMDALKAKTDPETQLKTLENVPETALVIVLSDGDTGFVTWVSAATAEMKGLEPEIAKKRLGYAVEKMFEGLPK